jgi:ribulose-bisphosphate carboxylase small chain
MSEIQDYKSKLSDPTSRRFETFSYLPEFTDEEIRRQAEYILEQGWQPAIEHTEPDNAMDQFWYMWKLPMFGETDVDVVLSEAKKCHEEHPGHHVKLIGYDWKRQTQGLALVIYRGPLE